MVSFLIQVDDDNRFMHDFTFYLDLAIKRNNWFHNEEVYKAVYSNDVKNTIFKNCIPVGSVEFVSSFYKEHFNINQIKPINIPDSLNKFEYLGRKIVKSTKENIESLKDGRYFIKDNSKIKGLTDIVYKKDIPVYKDMIVSELLDIESEWRGFIFRGNLLDIRSYSGDPFIFPNINKVRNMMKDFKEAPEAYTIDVGITSDGDTVLIEVHDFFSCGLYGFDDAKKLANMYISTHREILKKYIK